LRWRLELLAHFDTGLTNGRTEGFNLQAKLVNAELSAIDPSETIDCGS
jgi:hypothetical protein